jgi:Ca-activated chloride channel homolog
MSKYISLLLLIISVNSFGQAERKIIRSGNKLYENKKYTEAEIAYRKAIDKKGNSIEAGFNIGDALYMQGKYQEAAKQFLSQIDSTKNKNNLSKIYYNLGNSYFKANQLEESASAYKNALRNNPLDKDAKFNLSLVQKLLKKQQQQNKDNKDNKDKKDDKDKNKQDQKDQQNKQDKNKQDQDKQNQKDQQNKQDQNKQDQKNQQNKQDQQGGQGQNNKPKDQQNQISAGDAERILNAMKDDEKAVQMRVQQMKAKEDKEKEEKQKVNPSKNW